MTFRVCSKYVKFAGILAVIVTSSTLQRKLLTNGKLCKAITTFTLGSIQARNQGGDRRAPPSLENCLPLQKNAVLSLRSL